MLENLITRIEQWMKEIGPVDGMSSIVPDVYQSRWFLTPRQYAMESLCICSFYVFLLGISLQSAMKQQQWRNLRPIPPATTPDVVLGLLSLISVAVNFY